MADLWEDQGFGSGGAESDDADDDLASEPEDGFDDPEEPDDDEDDGDEGEEDGEAPPAPVSGSRSPEPFRRLVRHLDAVDAGTARAVVTEHHEALDRLGLTLERRLDRAFAGVPDPARDATSQGLPTDGVAEEHALHEPVDDDATADHRRRTMPSGSIATSTRAPGSG